MAEEVYLALLRKILANGKERVDRTGTGTISLFGEQLRFDVSNSVPILTTKFVPWKAVIKELLWFIKGQTDARILQGQGVHIWDGNTSREFLDHRGLGHLPEGDIGAGYGFQWRHASAQYKTCNDDYTGQGVDQLATIIGQLKNDPFSRRIFMTSWNAAQLEDMALPPCHVSVQFYVDQSSDGVKHLSAHMYQRSVDCFLGLPFNILSYTTLLYILAAQCGMQPKELIISTGDTHIYKDHIEQVQEQLSRAPFELPKLMLSEEVKQLPINDLTISHFNIPDYKYHPAIKAKMSV